MNRLRKVLQLPKRERPAFVRACFALASVRTMLAIRGYERAHRALRERVVEASRPDAHAHALRLAHAVREAAAAVPFRTSCLDRALALWWLLARDRTGGALRIGFRREGERLEAHAWVEHDGVVLLDDDAPRFTPFDQPLLAQSE